MNPLIIDAIHKRHLLSLWWQGGLRTVQPHAYGINTRGNEMLRCWQVSGYSRSNKVPGWKPILVGGVHSITLLDDNFEQHAEYKKNDRHLITIFAQV